MSSEKKVAKAARRRARMNDIGIPRDPSYTSFGRVGQPPLAQRLRTTLRYHETVQRTGLALYDYQFRLNGLQDPNQTGVGHQPKGFDQLAALYQRYRVYRVRYNVWFNGTNTAIAAHGVVIPTNSSTAYADAGDAIEAAYAQHVVVNAYQLRAINGKIDLAALNGKSHAAYAADDTTQSLVTTNPTEVMNLHVFTEALDGTTTLIAYLIVTLEYDVEFSDPVQLGQS